MAVYKRTRIGGKKVSRGKGDAPADPVKSYPHPEAQALVRPEVGAQPLFKKVRETAEYRYDSSLAPELQWDEKNPTREQGEALLGVIGDQLSVIGKGEKAEGAKKAAAKAREALEQLKRMSKPFLNWAGKAEKGELRVPTLPLFIHERLSTQAIVETLREHKKDLQEDFLGNLFGSPGLDVADQVTQAYEYPDQWVNRMILGDSLVVMNSLLRYESLGGQVQCIYIDPPYGVKFGSNFQPFVRKRDVSHNDDDDLTREPEMVQAYRDTWELGLHSYLTYLRDRLLLARDLLHPSGSVFVQISDENLHHVREVMDEVFGGENFVAIVVVKKTGGLGSSGVKSVADYLLWFAKDRERMKFRPLFVPKELGKGESTGERYDQLMSQDGRIRRAMTKEERDNPSLVPADWRAYQLDNLTSGAFRENTTVPYEFEGQTYHPGENACWKTTVDGLNRLKTQGRIVKAGSTLRYVRFLTDFPAVEVTNVWDDVAGAPDKLYIVQTSTKVIERCVLMTTDPGDLVLDPTCGSGTTAYVAEQWGRRWIAIDTSRVPLALARQRLLTATFPFYELKEAARGPAGGFVYKRKQNQKGEEVGGIVPHITLKSIANDEPPQEEVLVDRPEVQNWITRVSGPFTVEATIPTAINPDEPLPKPTSDELRGYQDRMLEVLRRAPVLRLAGNKTVTLRNVRAPAKTIALSAEALVEVSSFEFRVSRGGKDERGVSGTGGVAEGGGAGGGGVSEHDGLSAGGDLRSDGADAAGGGVGGEQHRGGAGAADGGGVSSVSGPRARLAAGVGDAVRSGPASGSAGRSERGKPSGAQRGDSQDAQLPDLETRNSKLATSPVAILFGPETGPLGERAVREAWDEAQLKRYTHLYVIGFAIDSKAREFVGKCAKMGMPATYLQATMDLQMGDLLKNMRSSQIFSVCGLPDVEVRRAKAEKQKRKEGLWEVEVVGLDTYDPATMQPHHLKADDLPAWFLDTNYNGLCFHVCQAFFPRTSAWENLKKALKADFDASVWDHLSGTVSAPFAPGDQKQIAVKVIDDRGNELMVVKKVG